MSQLLRNICSITGTFEKYAKKDGDCSSLSKAELKELIQREFVDVIVNPNDPETIQAVLQLLDTDCDGKVDFEEFTVLVFRVAKACYKKTQECQPASEGQSKRGEASQQKTQNEQAPGKDSSCQPTQAPKEASGCHPTAESQRPSQEQKPEPPKSGGQACQTPKQEQDPTHQRPQEPSGTSPAQSKNQDQRAKQCLTRVAQRSQQDCTQESQTIRDSSPHGPQECKTPDRGPTQEPQISGQRATRQPAQEHPGQGRTCQEVEPRKPEQQQPSCQPAQQEEQRPSQRETQRSQRGQQEVTSMKPRVPEQALNRQQWESRAPGKQGTEEKECHSQGSNQTPTCHPERKPHVPRQTTSGQQECGGALPSERQLHQQERRPQNQEQVPVSCPEAPSHRQEHRPQNPDQTPMCQAEQKPRVPQQAPSSCQECGSWTPEEQCRQQECRPQNPGQALMCHPKQECQVPQQAAAECTTAGRQQQRASQKPEEPQFCYYECEPLGPEQGSSPQDQWVSQGRESNRSCSPAEVPQDPNDSSIRQPTWPASHQKPLQFPSPWLSKH